MEFQSGDGALIGTPLGKMVLINHVQVEDLRKKWIDHSISVTVNLSGDVSEELVGNFMLKPGRVAVKAVVRTHDLGVIRNPYVILGFVVLVMFIIIFVSKMPERKNAEHSIQAKDTFKRLFKNVKYREGVIAQVFYVAAQIMCWTFIIQYAENLGINKATAQN